MFLLTTCNKKSIKNHNSKTSSPLEYQNHAMANKSAEFCVHFPKSKNIKNKINMDVVGNLCIPQGNKQEMSQNQVTKNQL